MSTPSYQDLYDIGVFAAQAKRPGLVVYAGDASDAMISASASMADLVVGYAAGRFRSTYLDGAEEADLTEEARDRGVERDEGAKAVGELTFSRPAIGGGGTIPAGFRCATQAASDGSYVEFVTTSAAVFLGSDLTKTAPAEAVVVGVASNVEAATVTRLIGTPFESTFTVSNAARFAGGAERQSDADLRDETRAFFLTQRRGTIDSLIYGAKQVPGVSRVSVVEDATGSVTVYVADEDGNSNLRMVALVEDELEEWRSAGTAVTVVGAALFSQAVSLALTVRAGVSVSALLDRVRDAVVARVARLQPGETLYRDMISAAARDVDRDGILQVDVVTPAANIAPSSTQVIRTSTSLVTVA